MSIHYGSKMSKSSHETVLKISMNTELCVVDPSRLKLEPTHCFLSSDVKSSIFEGSPGPEFNIWRFTWSRGSKAHLAQRPLDSGRSHSCLSGRRMTKDRITWRQVKVDWMIAGMLSSYLVDRPLAKVALPVPGLEMLHHLDHAHGPTSCREVKTLL